MEESKAAIAECTARVVWCAWAVSVADREKEVLGLGWVTGSSC